MFKCLRKPDIQTQIEIELDLAHRDLLEAEGILERAQANLDMLVKRVERLELKRAAYQD